MIRLGENYYTLSRIVNDAAGFLIAYCLKSLDLDEMNASTMITADKYLTFKRNRKLKM